MPPNNSRAFDDLEESERGESIDDSNSSDSSEEESTVKEKSSSDSDEKTTESEVTSSSGDLSSEDDDSKGNDDDKAPKGNKTAAMTAAAAAACVYALEKCRQKKLTKVPLVLGQFPQDSQIQAICQKLTDENAILSQPIVPSLFVGTHGQLASTAAFMNPGPKRLRYSETVISSYDGAEVCLDWDISNNDFSQREEIASISRPTVLILHGINNSSDYGYIKGLQKTMTNRGWNAVAMNFRGAARGGTQKMTTPRSYTASYTGDLRSVVNQLSQRVQPNSHGCLVLVGNSLGGIIVTKYLGEEGLAGTLPKTVLGGISLGNPFAFFASHIGFPFGQMIGAARKFNYYCQRRAMSMNHSKHSQNHALDVTKLSLASLDRALAPTMVRTEAHPPFGTKIGYGHAKQKEEDNDDNDTAATAAAAAMSAAEEYWIDTGCYKQGRHVSVPLLHVMARDDTLCFGSARHFLNYALRNPNVMVVQTRTGGHLGWWHSSKKSQSWLGLDSWTDGATADFIQAVLDTHKPSSLPTDSVTKIDDAHNLFAPTTSINSSDDSGKTSMQALPGDHDGDSTIASKDQMSHHYNGNRLQTKQGDIKPSKTYVEFQQVLLMRRHGEEEGEQIRFLERNRLVEKRESIEFSRMLQSRL